MRASLKEEKVMSWVDLPRYDSWTYPGPWGLVASRSEAVVRLPARNAFSASPVLSTGFDRAD